jgi:hypothetical protein
MEKTKPETYVPKPLFGRSGDEPFHMRRKK